MKSMTGFASKSTDQISLKLKSVNHRFFDFRCHGPQGLMSLEKEMRGKVNKFVSRGSLDLFIQVQNYGKSSAQKLDLEKAKDFQNNLKKMSADLNLDLNNEVGLILKYGDVFVGTSNTKEDVLQTSDFSKNDFFKLIDDLLQDFQSERMREGKALALELKILLKSLEQVRLKLKVLAKDYPKELEQKINEKVKIWNQEFSPERLNQELLLLIDKADIQEEVIRLKEHIKACLNLLSSKDSEGKKLDFYAQELFREVNTIGSKSSSVEITQEVMQAKAIIEKIRQQVQNIE